MLQKHLGYQERRARKAKLSIQEPNAHHLLHIWSPKSLMVEESETIRRHWSMFQLQTWKMKNKCLSHMLDDRFEHIKETNLRGATAVSSGMIATIFIWTKINRHWSKMNTLFVNTVKTSQGIHPFQTDDRIFAKCASAISTIWGVNFFVYILTPKMGYGRGLCKCTAGHARGQYNT